MDIFTKNEILFFLTGAWAVGFVWLLIRSSRRRPFKWYSWVLALTAGFLAVFALLWAVSSVLEGEPQAANMGLLLFGVPALVLLGITARIVFREEGSGKQG